MKQHGNMHHATTSCRPLAFATATTTQFAPKNQLFPVADVVTVNAGIIFTSHTEKKTVCMFVCPCTVNCDLCDDGGDPFFFKSSHQNLRPHAGPVARPEPDGAGHLFYDLPSSPFPRHTLTQSVLLSPAKLPSSQVSNDNPRGRW